MRDLLERLLNSTRLNDAELVSIFEDMLAGKLSDSEIAAFLTCWRLQGEGADELFAGATVLRRHAARVDLPPAVRPLCDNCGTGGDGAGSFNISTAAAVVAASAGVRVAKHGNRSVSSRCGSADLIFAAGLPGNLPPANAVKLLQNTGFTFFFAPNYHPILRAVGPVRKSLGVRTIFNLLGPLANPIAPEVQLIGVGAKKYIRPMAEAMNRLGLKKGLVVHSRDGLDEISPAAATDAILLADNQLTEYVFEPGNLGLSTALADLRGGDAAENLQLFTALLANQLPRLADAVAVNAGAVLWLAGKSDSLADGLALARGQIGNGIAQAFFQNWIKEAQSTLSP